MCINILQNQDIKAREHMQTCFLFFGFCFANILLDRFYCNYILILIIFEMGYSNFMPIFDFFFLFEGILHGYHCLHILYFQSDRILRLN